MCGDIGLFRPRDNHAGTKCGRLPHSDDTQAGALADTGQQSAGMPAKSKQKLDKSTAYRSIDMITRTVCVEKAKIVLISRKKEKREADSKMIVKRKAGCWQGQYVFGRDPTTGKLLCQTVYGKMQQEVAEKLLAATSSISNGTFQALRKITLEEYAQEYLQTCTITPAH